MAGLRIEKFVRNNRNKDTFVGPADRLLLEYNPTEEDQARNNRRSWHPRPFDKTPDAQKKIRLLKIVPLDGQDASSPIQCYFLDSSHFANKISWDRMEYTALSYTWGPAASSGDVKDIIIYGEPVSVRCNLWDFLHAMRQSQNEGPFWIDALCIDQLQLEEKARQLELMPKIYEKASVVLVWLGACEEALESNGIRLLYNQLNLREPTSTSGDTHRRYGLKYMVENKYWTRLWIVQEIFMARKIHVYTGGHRWDFSDLMRIQRKFEAAHPDINWENWKGIVETKQTWDRKKKHHLHNVLHQWSHQECRDTHDKVYGLLGLVSKTKINIDLSISEVGLFEAVLEAEKKHIYARKFPYTSEFAERLMKSLGLQDNEDAGKIKIDFLKAWKGKS
ncbi:HET-domain-containing protein [Setomelanomma holmii]|uniref:HET-domain-containing protein n=1 Tax=Setomelanomma holmii TaxID=210430 RepID=A0A9P4LK79_9PLEO|nr:HET-domain-containing protein [Setomelanomma holmii]